VLVPGANSFTETQARERMMKYGLSTVETLKKDDQGIWRGRGMKGGKAVDLGLDFKGNIVEVR
jgi:hypothetical protein